MYIYVSLKTPFKDVLKKKISTVEHITFPPSAFSLLVRSVLPPSECSKDQLDSHHTCLENKYQSYYKYNTCLLASILDGGAKGFFHKVSYIFIIFNVYDGRNNIKYIYI